ncbi:MAG: polysaccharide deacetylase family protein [Bdellovibrionales bacterium]|nr:polysaccharide deacetylase family protein [Bdellovibrionales bacterium]
MADEQQLVSDEFLRRLYRRLVTALTFYTGQLEVERQRALKRGDLPYRILRYQHVINPEDHLYPLSRTSYVRPKTFERHCRYLAKHCHVLPLHQLASLLEKKEPIPERSVAITFDCGYADVLSHAFPHLSLYRLPATVFLPTAYIDENNLFWYDKVLGVMLLLQLHDQPFPRFPQLRDVFWEMLEEQGSLEKIELAHIALFVEELKRMPLQPRYEIIGLLGQAADSLGGLPGAKFFLDWTDVKALGRVNISFGTMGHGHKDFSELPHEEIVADLNASSTAFRQQEVIPAPVFSYPEGNVTKELRKLLPKFGIKYSVGVGPYPAPNLEKSIVPLFGRLDIFEANSFSVDSFACTLWEPVVSASDAGKSDSARSTK